MIRAPRNRISLGERSGWRVGRRAASALEPVPHAADRKNLGAAGCFDLAAQAGDVRVTRLRAGRIAANALDLSPKEFDLLAHLAARAGTVVSKRELLTEVWQLPYGGSDKTVDVHLSWLRRKLGESAAEPRLLQTVRGVGVRLAEPDA